MIQYYRVLKLKPYNYSDAIWHGDSSKAHFLVLLGDFIIPLGTRKPKNVSRETIKNF